MRLKMSPRTAALCGVGLFLTAILADGTARAGLDFDNQLWLYFKTDIRLAKRIAFFSYDELRIGNDVSEGTYFHGEAGAQFFIFREILSAGLQYRQVFVHGTWYYSEDGNPMKAWDAEYQPGIFFQVKIKPGRVILSERLRLEIPIFENNRAAGVRLRHLTTLGVMVPRGHPKAVMPYLRNVQIFSLHPDADYLENWLSLGLEFPVKDSIIMDVFYMWQRKQDTKGDFFDYFILGVGICFKVKQILPPPETRTPSVAESKY